MNPPIDGLSPLGRAVYAVSAPVVSASTSSDASERQREFYRRFRELRPEVADPLALDKSGPALQ